MKRLPGDEDYSISPAPSPDRASDVDWNMPTDISDSESDITKWSEISAEEIQDISDRDQVTGMVDAYFLRSTSSIGSHKRAIDVAKTQNYEFSQCEEDLSNMEFINDSDLEVHELPLVVHNVNIYPRKHEAEGLKALTTSLDKCSCAIPSPSDDYALFYFYNKICIKRFPLEFAKSGAKLILKSSDKLLLQFFEENPLLGKYIKSIDQLVMSYSPNRALCLMELDSCLDDSQKMTYTLWIKIEVTLKSFLYRDNFQYNVSHMAYYAKELKECLTLIKEILKTMSKK